MATFNISNCKFIKTVDDPKKYYMDTLRKYISKTSDPSTLESDVEFFTERLIRLLAPDNINSPEILHKIAYFTFDRVWYSVCEDTTKTPHRSLALERDVIIDDVKRFKKGRTFYSKCRDSFRDSLYSLEALLTSKNEIGQYAVVDLDAVSEYLHSELNKYYNNIEKVNPKLLTSSYPTKALHLAVENAFQYIGAEFYNVIYNVNTKPQNWTF